MDVLDPGELCLETAKATRRNVSFKKFTEFTLPNYLFSALLARRIPASCLELRDPAGMRDYLLTIPNGINLI